MVTTEDGQIVHGRPTQMVDDDVDDQIPPAVPARPVDYDPNVTSYLDRRDENERESSENSPESQDDGAWPPRPPGRRRRKLPENPQAQKT
ncbi:Hypothetical protein NTJ_13305 [Nesidiocoris tenuis]|uniref:Uncharacterized protein n=1 Tax=Nesidiocoris tenuis TaxID=355587 RepID=A0ABN7B883_9HEMI|nr:Hypothetical protein NTJ_13305 [Nesidiocoris tenuis]